MSDKKSFIADRRGAVAFETLIVYPVLVALVLMSLAEMAVAGFQFASAWAALRSFVPKDPDRAGCLIEIGLESPPGTGEPS